jgi:DNA-binding NarL/FixJ family response regulator
VIRLLIADDHPVTPDGLTGTFSAESEFEVVGEAGDGAEAVRLAGLLQPDVILMALCMPGIDGATAVGELARRGAWPQRSAHQDKSGRPARAGTVETLASRVLLQEGGPQMT